MISSVLGVPRSGMHQHVFVGGNFLMQQMLNRYRDELGCGRTPAGTNNRIRREPSNS